LNFGKRACRDAATLNVDFGKLLPVPLCTHQFRR